MVSSLPLICQGARAHLGLEQLRGERRDALTHADCASAASAPSPSPSSDVPAPPPRAAAHLPRRRCPTGASRPPPHRPRPQPAALAALSTSLGCRPRPPLLPPPRCASPVLGSAAAPAVACCCPAAAAAPAAPAAALLLLQREGCAGWAEQRPVLPHAALSHPLRCACCSCACRSARAAQELPPVRPQLACSRRKPLRRPRALDEATSGKHCPWRSSPATSERRAWTQRARPRSPEPAERRSGSCGPASPRGPDVRRWGIMVGWGRVPCLFDTVAGVRRTPA